MAVFAVRMASRRCFLTAIAVLALVILLVAMTAAGGPAQAVAEALLIDTDTNVAFGNISLGTSLGISLSLGVPACVSGGGDALLAGADENSWQSRPRHACASSALTWAAPTTVQKHCPRKRHTLMAGSSAYAHGRHC